MKLEPPLHRFLDGPIDEARISGMWKQIRAGREPRAPLGRRAVYGGLAFAVAAAIVFAFWPAPPAAIHLADGAALGDLTTGSAPRSIALDDGSRIELSPDTELHTLMNDENRLTTMLVSGRARFMVNPGGPRRWVIETGLATVEVVGTVFTVERTPDALTVSVERGVVLVRGERVRERVARLERGAVLRIEADPIVSAVLPGDPRIEADPIVSAVLPGDPRIEADPIAAEARIESDERATAAPSTGEEPDAIAMRRDAPTRPERAIPPTAERQAPDRTIANLDVGALILRADAERDQGRVAEAAALLERAAAHEDDPRAALASFTLGRIEMDDLHRPDRARAALERALSLGLPNRLAEQARLRLDALAR